MRPVCNPSTEEAETEGSEIPDQPQLHRVQSSLKPGSQTLHPHTQLEHFSIRILKGRDEVLCALLSPGLTGRGILSHMGTLSGLFGCGSIYLQSSPASGSPPPLQVKCGGKPLPCDSASASDNSGLNQVLLGGSRDFPFSCLTGLQCILTWHPAPSQGLGSITLLLTPCPNLA